MRRDVAADSGEVRAVGWATEMALPAERLGGGESGRVARWNDGARPPPPDSSGAKERRIDDDEER
jgi:hypothetical protein